MYDPGCMCVRTGALGGWWTLKFEGTLNCSRLWFKSNYLFGLLKCPDSTDAILNSGCNFRNGSYIVYQLNICLNQRTDGVVVKQRDGEREIPGSNPARGGNLFFENVA